MQIAVDVETVKKVSPEAAKGDVGDDEAFGDPVGGAGDKAEPAGAHADGAYDSRSNSSHLSERAIDPLIEARRNSSRRAGVSPRGSSRRRSASSTAIENGGEKKHRYGVGWMVEAAFSASKRTSGGHVAANSVQNMIGEQAMGANLYNLFISMNPQGRQITNGRLANLIQPLNTANTDALLQKLALYLATACALKLISTPLICCMSNI